MTLSYDLYWSFRSPYSYFVMERLVALERDYDVRCNVRVVYPIAVRQPELIKQAFATGIESELATLASQDLALSESEKSAARATRIDTLAHVVGALVLSRACPDDSPLADEILEICRTRILSGHEQKGEGSAAG